MVKDDQCMVSVQEPPRDGEFALQAEFWTDEALVRTAPWPRRGLWLLDAARSYLGRYPLSSVGIAVAAGVLLSSLVLKFPLLP